jgi:hypothetical protein
MRLLKGLMLAGIAAFTLVGCAAGGDFRPKTIQGAQCKSTCAQNMANCRGSSYTCDRAAATCMASCVDLDDLAARK